MASLLQCSSPGAREAPGPWVAGLPTAHAPGKAFTCMGQREAAAVQKALKHIQAIIETHRPRAVHYAAAADGQLGCATLPVPPDVLQTITVAMRTAVAAAVVAKGKGAADPSAAPASTKKGNGEGAGSAGKGSGGGAGSADGQSAAPASNKKGKRGKGSGGEGAGSAAGQGAAPASTKKGNGEGAGSGSAGKGSGEGAGSAAGQSAAPEGTRKSRRGKGSDGGGAGSAADPNKAAAPGRNGKGKAAILVEPSQYKDDDPDTHWDKMFELAGTGQWGPTLFLFTDNLADYRSGRGRSEGQGSAELRGKLSQPTLNGKNRFVHGIPIGPKEGVVFGSYAAGQNAIERAFRGAQKLASEHNIAQIVFPATALGGWDVHPAQQDHVTPLLAYRLRALPYAIAGVEQPGGHGGARGGGGGQAATGAIEDLILAPRPKHPRPNIPRACSFPDCEEAGSHSVHLNPSRPSHLWRSL